MNLISLVRLLESSMPYVTGWTLCIRSKSFSDIDYRMFFITRDRRQNFIGSTKIIAFYFYFYLKVAFSKLMPTRGLFLFYIRKRSLGSGGSRMGLLSSDCRMSSRAADVASDFVSWRASLGIKLRQL